MGFGDLSCLVLESRGIECPTSGPTVFLGVRAAPSQIYGVLVLESGLLSAPRRSEALLKQKNWIQSPRSALSLRVPQLFFSHQMPWHFCAIACHCYDGTLLAHWHLRRDFTKLFL